MYKIIEKRKLAPQVTMMTVEAPYVAKKAQPGQFIILRPADESERIPLTIADYDREQGLITIIFQDVGKTTRLLSALEQNEYIRDLAGPLGVASHLDGIRNACVIGGGLGCAIAYPQAKALYAAGAHVDVVAGFRSRDLVIMEDEMRAVCGNLYMCTDDGTYGRKGLVTEQLKELIESGAGYDAVIAIGPLIMMKFVSLTTKPYGIRTIVSMNTTMIDGTGMCGGCRLTVAGEVKFACVDGPDFDGHKVDFDEAMRRSMMYREMEKQSLESHECNLLGDTRHG